MKIEPRLLTDHELDAIASANDVYLPYAWSPEHMGEEHYALAGCAVNAVPTLLGHIAALRAELAAMDEGHAAFVSALAEEFDAIHRELQERTRENPAAAVRLVRHLLSAQVDNPDHIYLISPHTQSYELLLGAAEALFGQPRADIERSIESERKAIEQYRPLIASVERFQEEAERYERALNEIAYEHPSDPAQVARRALSDQESR